MPYQDHRIRTNLIIEGIYLICRCIVATKESVERGKVIVEVVGIAYYNNAVTSCSYREWVNMIHYYILSRCFLSETIHNYHYLGLSSFSRIKHCEIMFQTSVGHCQQYKKEMYKDCHMTKFALHFNLYSGRTREKAQ